jgi:lipopolysaccharide/colanic/teichoic acid biosynthesis glycosyltransferase
MLNRYLTRPFAMLGDIVVLSLALLTALFVRAQAIPQASFLAAHLDPFLLVLGSSILVYFISGLYDLHTITLKRVLLSKLLYAQIANAGIALVFFYFITIWGITPKTILVLYILFSSLYLILWRAFLFPHILGNLPKDPVYIFANRTEGQELFDALNDQSPHPYIAKRIVFLDKEGSDVSIVKEIDELLADTSQKPIVVVDRREQRVSDASDSIYRFVGSGGEVLSFSELYESVFDKIPKSSLQKGHIIPYIYSRNKGYDSMKRLIDVCIAAPMFVISLVVYPCVYLAIKIQDRGPVFFAHDRVGRGGKKIRLYKFRSMTFGDTSATWVRDDNNPNKVTKLGYFLRKTRIDELPQLWNVLRGDISLVGPRPDVWALGEKLHAEIPFYAVRYVATPGLSGWAQTHMSTPPQTVEETKERLLYDLYYIKHRSLFLDILIALKTIKTLLSREGM